MKTVHDAVDIVLCEAESRYKSQTVWMVSCQGSVNEVNEVCSDPEPQQTELLAIRVLPG